jgi:predicted metal-binding protein
MSMQGPGDRRTTIFVCITCRRNDEPLEPLEARSGHRFHARLAISPLPDRDIKIQPVACLSNCNRGCNVAFASPGKWTFVIGDLNPDSNAGDVLSFAAQYSDHVEGLPVWRERPECIRKGVAARVPPLSVREQSEECAAP